MKKKKIIIIFLGLFIFFSLSVSASEVDVGGEVKVLSALSITENEISHFSLEEKLNLNLYLPETDRTEARFEIDINNSSSGVSGEVKKLYLKRKFNNFNLTLGRQPISWSFGSMINPVDFNLGAEVMDEATSAKYLDALDIYVPVNWGTGLELAVVPKLKEIHNGERSKYNYLGTKFGLRGRTTVSDFDLAANYVHSPENIHYKDRFALSLKGDIGPIAAYSAVSYEPSDKGNEYVYLTGLDYSMAVNYTQRIYFQGEVINFSKDKISSLIAGKLLISPEFSFTDDRYSLFLGNVSYSLNNFSDIAFMSGVNLNDGSLFVMPRYTNQLPGNLTLEISSSLLSGDKGDMFHESGIPLSISLSYPF